MSEPVKIVVVIEGGVVQSIITAGVAVRCVVVDYDTEGADASEYTQVPQARGDDVDAFVREACVDADGAWCLDVFQIAEARS